MCQQAQSWISAQRQQSCRARPSQAGRRALRRSREGDESANDPQHDPQDVMPRSILITDEHRPYKGLSGDYVHVSVVEKVIHINSIESVWALLKRQIVGIHHNVSPKQLSRYVDELSLRSNCRDIHAPHEDVRPFPSTLQSRPDRPESARPGKRRGWWRGQFPHPPPQHALGHIKITRGEPRQHCGLSRALRPRS